MHWRWVFILFFLSLALTACGTNKSKTAALTPLPGAVTDPGNEVFMAAVDEYIAARGGPRNSRYAFTRIDLDGDGRRDGILLLTAPYESWCDDNGCRLVVFHAQDDGFTVVSEIPSVRGPLTVSPNRTHGWRDLIVRISGRFDEFKHDVALRYDGQSYPLQTGLGVTVETNPDDTASPGVKILP